VSAILVTGATGTFGRAYLRRCLASGRWDRVVALSRDEVKQAQLAEDATTWVGGARLRLFLGDVRDYRRMLTAMRAVDCVVHAAALKRVDAGAYSPGEMIETNVLGTRNVVDAAIDAGVARVVVISSDKAVHATNIYGASKYCAETYAVQQNAVGFPAGTRIAAVRYGNVLGSRGSVVHLWRAQAAASGRIRLTDVRMTRFLMTIEQACELVDHALAHTRGGEVFVPVLRAASMLALAGALVPEAEIDVVGLRPGGEKLAEQLLNEEEPSRTIRQNGVYMVLPSHHEWTSGDHWVGEVLGEDFLPYRSDLVTPRMTQEEIRVLLASSEACR
jgi:UDP-N-acetylglucosamine 4,6-dehydratase